MQQAHFRTETMESETVLCPFLIGDNEQHFGRIALFVNMPTPQALVRKFHRPSQSLLKQAGPPCQPVLAVYKVDLLNSFFYHCRCTTPLLVVPTTAIQGKVTLVKNESSTYVIKQPNQYEHY